MQTRGKNMQTRGNIVQTRGKTRRKKHVTREKKHAHTRKIEGNLETSRGVKGCLNSIQNTFQFVIRGEGSRTLTVEPRILNTIQFQIQNFGIDLSNRSDF